MRRREVGRVVVAGAAALGALLAGSACGPAPAPTSTVATAAAPRAAAAALRFGAFSATREVFGTRMLPAYARSHFRHHGQQLDVDTLFTGSEALTAAIGTTFAADVAVLAHTHDLERLVRQGLVARERRQQPHGGIVCRSLVVLAVRKGNPERIRDWADLVRPGVAIVDADPATSGGGAWNLCALYGAALRGHAGVPAGDPDAARAFVARVRANVVERAASAGAAFASFRGGAGDVVITYESEVALGWLFGSDVERVVPASTLLVESPAVVVDRNADAHGVRERAQALCDHLWTPEAQRQLARCGLRPVDPAVFAANRARFPDPEDLWTIEFLGGWERAVRDVLQLAAPAASPAGR